MKLLSFVRAVSVKLSLGISFNPTKLETVETSKVGCMIPISYDVWIGAKISSVVKIKFTRTCVEIVYIFAWSMRCPSVYKYNTTVYLYGYFQVTLEFTIFYSN